MLKRNGIRLAITGFVLGVLMGGFGVWILSTRFANGFMMNAKSADTITTVRTLEQLRRGNTTGTLELLELELDGSLIELGAWMETASPNRWDPSELKTIQNARDYRTKFPRTNGPPEVVEGVARTFRLLDSSRQQ
jgi:hypothetical protein